MYQLYRTISKRNNLQKLNEVWKKPIEGIFQTGCVLNADHRKYVLNADDCMCEQNAELQNFPTKSYLQIRR